MTVRTVVDLAAVCICIAINLITSLQIVSAGSGIADYAVKTGSAALLLLLTLMIGGDLRRITQKQAPEQPAPAMGDTQVITKA